MAGSYKVTDSKTAQMEGVDVIVNGTDVERSDEEFREALISKLKRKETGVVVDLLPAKYKTRAAANLTAEVVRFL